MTGLLTASNLLMWSIQAALVIAAALAGLRVLRIDAPAVRYSMLRVVLALCLALPVLQLQGGLIVAPSARGAAAGGPTTFAAAAGPSVQAEQDGPFGAGVAASAVLLLLAGGALSRLCWLAAGVVRLRRLRRIGELVPPMPDLEELQQVIEARPAVRFVRGLGQPVTFGFRHPVVLLPHSLPDRPRSIQRAVLAHELWHVRRRDWTWTLGEEAVRALFWFNPAIWILLSRIQAAREEVVDELSILSTGSRRGYADALLAFADEAPLFAATAFARRRHLVHRMVLISKEAVMSAKRVVACSVMVAGVVMGAGWYAVGAFPLVQAQPSDFLSAKAGPVELKARPVTPENPVPRRIASTPADYPADASSLDLRGTVTVRVVLDEAGRVAETRATALQARLADKMTVSFNAVGSGADPIMNMRGLMVPGTSPAALLAALESIAKAATRAVGDWQYAAPAEGPIAFTVAVPVGPGESVDAVTGRAGALPGARPASSADRGAIRVGGNIKPPTKVRNVNPVYPPVAIESKVQGVVIIEARIEGDGTVSDTHVLRSIPLLDAAAVEAVRQWQFTPTLLNGVPVAVIMTTTVNFTLQ